MPQQECSHDLIEKFVTIHGLACEACLTEKDFVQYPGWKQRLATREKKAAQLDQNLGRNQEIVTVE